MNHSSIHQFKNPTRTEGDGMERNSAELETTSKLKIKSLAVGDKPSTGNIIHITTKKQVKTKNMPFNITYHKEPRFVPYEPYKAAVKPIIPHRKHTANEEKEVYKKSSDTAKNLPSINNLSIKENDKIDRQTSLKENDKSGKESSLWSDQEKQVLQTELSRLKQENYELENQLKFQVQVNGELKKLLVAAVGEDIEVRVQLLTQDKLHLATELLKTAKCLSTHQEQIEWLAGHCEVWRSKFLASSCLVEDLAKWKAGLSQKMIECKDTLKHLLDEINKMKKDIRETHYKLSILQKNFNLSGDYGENDGEYKAQNVVDMCSSNLNLTNRLMAQLLGNVQIYDNKLHETSEEKILTDAEKCAIQLINQPMISPEQTEIACNAVMMGASIALTSSSPHCAHCNGTIKTI